MFIKACVLVLNIDILNIYKTHPSVCQATIPVNRMS